MKTELKIIIEDDPDDRDALRRIVNADSAYKALYEMQDLLHHEWKSNDDAPIEYLERLRDNYADILEDNGINLDLDYR